MPSRNESLSGIWHVTSVVKQELKTFQDRVTLTLTPDRTLGNTFRSALTVPARIFPNSWT